MEEITIFFSLVYTPYFFAYLECSKTKNFISIARDHLRNLENK